MANKKVYQNGKSAGNAKMNALKELKERMTSMGGDSLMGSLDENAYKDGGVVKASVVAKDEDDLKKGLKKAAKMIGKYEDGGIVGSEEEDHSEELDFDDMSREELLERLKNR